MLGDSGRGVEALGVEAFRVEGGAEASGVEAFGVEDFLGVPGLGLEGLGGGVEAFGGESVASSPQTFWASCPLSTTRCRPEDEAPPVGSGLFGTIVVVVVVVESFGGGFERWFRLLLLKPGLLAGRLFNLLERRNWRRQLLLVAKILQGLQKFSCILQAASGMKSWMIVCLDESV